MQEVQTLISDVETSAKLPPGDGERFSGYALMGVPFRTGHVLGLRRFPVTSIGPGYTSVWLRKPDDRWIIYTTIDAAHSCPRYFGSALESTSVQDISVTWHQGQHFSVSIKADVGLQWDVTLTETPMSRTMSKISSTLPERAWRNSGLLKAMGVVAGPSLRAGHVGLQGRTPNKQRFVAGPKQMWLVQDSRATLQGTDLGPIAPLPAQTRLGDFWIPQRGIFMIGTAAFESFNPTRHLPPTPARQ